MLFKTWCGNWVSLQFGQVLKMGAFMMMVFFRCFFVSLVFLFSNLAFAGPSKTQTPVNISINPENFCILVDANYFGIGGDHSGNGKGKKRKNKNRDDELDGINEELSEIAMILDQDFVDYCNENFGEN